MRAASKRDCDDSSYALPEWLFQLPYEEAPSTKSMATWLQLMLRKAHITTPVGFALRGHSLRSGGASAAEAIGVSRFKANWLGGWAQSGNTREKHYLDPTVPATREAYQFFGWLLANNKTN